MFNKLAQELIAESIAMFGKEKAAEKQPLEYHMLMVSEIAEATECARLNLPPIYLDESGKPQGKVVELADALIRLINYCGHRGFDLDKAFEIKRVWNLNKRNWKVEGKNI